MSLVLPNIEDAPSYDAMAVRDSADYFAISCMAQGTGVVSGASVGGTSGNMTVSVAAGVIAVGGTNYYMAAAASLTVNAASTSDRRDSVVYIVGTGASVIAGTPCGYTTGNWNQNVTTNNPPVKPTMPANSVLLAEVYVAGSGGTATTAITTATNIVDKRNITSQLISSSVTDVAEGAGTKGGGLVQSGYNVNGTRVAATDMIIGDSISYGIGSTVGSTDWATVFSNLENTSQGLPAQGPGFVPCYQQANLAGWSNTANGTTPASILLSGPAYGNGAGTTSSLQLASTGKSISDTRPFRRVKVFYQTTYNGDGITFAVTGGSSASVDTNSAATSASVSGFVVTVPTANLVGQAPNVGDAVVYQSGGSWTWATPPAIQSITTSGSNTLITLTVTLGGGTGTTGSTISFSGYRMWDSGDLGSVIGSAISATWATHASGSGGSGSYVLGARYYLTAGTNGISIDNFGIDGMFISSLSNSAAAITPTTGPWGWVQWLQMNVNAGTPIRRMYICGGINDATLAGASAATYGTNLQFMVTTANAVSPTTEVVLIAEYYGDIVVTYGSTVTTSGSPVIYNTAGNFQVGALGAVPSASSTIGGPGIPAATTVTTAPSASTTVSTSATISGTSLTGATGLTNGGVYAISGPGITGLMLCTATSTTTGTISTPTGGGTSTGGTGTFTLQPALTMSANATASATITAQVTLLRFGVTNWLTWVAAAAQVAQTKSSTFVNLYERFGDISARGQATLTAGTTSSSVLTCSAGFPNATAGMAVNGSGIPPGVTVLSGGGSATTMTLSTQVTVSNGTTIYYGQDIYGQCNSSVPNIHMADYANSWSGSDGQTAMAGYIWSRLNSIYKAEMVMGSDTSAVAASVSSAFVTTTPLQLSTTSDVMLYIEVTTSAALRVRMGPTSSGTGINIGGTSESMALGLMSVRVPKGWYVRIDGTIADLLITAVTC